MSITSRITTLVAVEGLECEGSGDVYDETQPETCGCGVRVVIVKLHERKRRGC